MLSTHGVHKATCVALFCTLALGLTKAAQQRINHLAHKTGDSQRKGTAAAQSEIYTTAIRENVVGMALMERHEFSEALPRFQRACILNPVSDTGCLNMGIALLNMGRYDDARVVLTKSAERDPENPRPWFNLGLLERESGRLAAAAQDFEKAAALDPDDADTQYFLGDLAEAAQHYDEAATAFENAISLDPAHASAEYGLAQAEEHRGDAAGAQAHLARFQHLSSSRFATPLRSVYGEQGKYSLAQQMEVPPQRAPAAIPVRFVDVTSVSGLPWRLVPTPKRNTPAAGTRGKASLTGGEGAKSATTLAEFLGSGACLLDYDGDGRPDIFLVNADGQGHAALYRNTGRGSFINVTKAAKLEFRGEGTGCAVGDYDNDGHPDLAVSSHSGIALFHNQGDGTFVEVTDVAGVRTVGLVLGLTFVDYDGDGNLDLFVTRFNDFPLDHAEQPFLFPEDAPPPGNVLWRNQGDGTFVDVTKEAGVAGNAPSVGIVATDINNDRAVDLILTGWQKFPALLVNSRDGGFRAANPWAISMPGPTAGAVAFDFSHDGWMDFAFTHWASPGMSVWRNVVGRSFERVPLVGPGWMRGWGIAAIDYDNDGWTDLVAVGETFSGEGRIVLYRNEGSGGFRDATHETGLDKVILRHPRSVLAFDFDGDGAVDLLITQNGGPPVLLRNIGGNKNHWMELKVTGDLDNRFGRGARVDLFAGVDRQTLQVSGASGYLGQGPAEITVGLGAENAADVIRILWPNGVVQDEMQVPAGVRRVVAEGSKP
jgi:Flp pilus assembly protein TadD